MGRRERRDQPGAGDRDHGADDREASADRREQALDIREGVLDRWERELAERARALGVLDDDEEAAIDAARERRADARRDRWAAAEGRHEAAIERGIERARAEHGAPASEPVAAMEEVGAAAIAQLADLLARPGRLPDVLAGLLAMALDTVPEAAAVTVCLLVDGRLEPAAGTAGWATTLDAAQLRGGTGPLAGALASGSVVVTDRLAADPRWDLGRAAGGDGDRGAVCVPILAGGEAAGVLSVYAERDAALDRRSVLAAAMVAVQVSLAVVWGLERLAHLAQADAWERAVASRDQIGQAKGILMAEQGLTDDEAFDILRATSQHENTKVRDVARRIVEDRDLPDPPARPPAP